MKTRNLALICSSLLLAMLLVAGLPFRSKTDTSSVTAVSPAGPSRPTGTATAANMTLSSAASQSIASRGPDSLALNIARRNHSATALPDGRVLVIGGDNERGVVGEVETLGVSSRTVSVTARLSVARTQHSAILLQDGRVLVSGGFDSNGPLGSSEIFDPKTNAFAPGPRLQKARAGHSATVRENGKVLIAGGQDDLTPMIAPNGFNNNTSRGDGGRIYASAR